MRMREVLSSGVTFCVTFLEGESDRSDWSHSSLGNKHLRKRCRNINCTQMVLNTKVFVVGNLSFIL